MKPSPPNEQARSVSLVLGSGGARGLAHIGVIRWLEGHGYEIRSIAGSSVGALVGGIYAAGQLDTYATWVKALRRRDVMQLLDFAFSRSGIFSGDRIIQRLRDMLGDVQIQDLPISFTAVATDLDQGREVWLRKGSLFDAIRASIAIPTVFTPVVYEGRLLVDGGLLNPVPMAPTLSDLTDIRVAVSLSGKEESTETQLKRSHRRRAERDDSYQAAIRDFIQGLQRYFPGWKRQEREPVNMLELMSRSLESMQNTIARFKLAAYSPDYLVEIPSNACGLFEFYRAEELIELGYAMAERELGRTGH
jgi:NTE family protein